MKAVIIEEYGGKEKLKEAEVPMPKAEAHQVIVKERATSINPIDWKLREGYLQQMMPWEFPIILGWDVAGEIVEVGSEITNWKIGDRVFARPETTRFGTYAEYTAVDDNLLAYIPENVTYEEAAAAPLAGLTAWQALFDYGKLAEGEKVLIHAGSGGVGTYAIQLAKSKGAFVISTASESNRELLMSLGVDQFIDYKNEDFTELLSDVDVIFDTMGGEVLENSFKVVKPHTGRIISIVGDADKELIENADITFNNIWLEPNGKQLTELAQLMEQGKVKSIIGETYPLTEKGIYDAHAMSETHHAVGKIVIKVGE
ncbi:NADP-dependent oxidoreductase [Carnobacterium viridans]|uniref:NADPH:quinone reductase n=1 Tax=Carnobacterium viridans TaxID=174587 RepID=A0A1H1B590_9LACT|nr:NADP-dependent oxidoreductase [Carnobacterium viridans]UDE95942.1 NADP-dependent oxidoreductase [Carnobacterium viridans]SDQ46576.1 NADPH:quinone reductase [Carnobacterium viridans]